MLDLGFFEIALIAILAVIVLGPDKLPEAMRNVFRFLKKISSFISETKESFDRELQIQELREEAQKYKKELMETSNELEDLTNRTIRNPLADEMEDLKNVKISGQVGNPKPKIEEKSATSELKNLVKK